MGQAETQTRPPLGVRLRYRIGVRVPPEWVPWVAADLQRPGWLRRQLAGQFLVVLAFALAVYVGVAASFGDPSWGDLSGVLVLFGAWVVQIVLAPYFERTRVFAGNRRLILAYHRGERGDFWTPSRSTIPWMVAGVLIAIVIILVVRALA